LATRATAIATRHKVLLVDDDAVSLELMAMLLAHEGHHVLRAADAGSALALLSGDKGARPDVLLVDLQMPGVSGGQLADRIRALEGPNPLMLAMSATEVQRQQLLSFDGFLLKPLAVDDFRRALKPKKRGHLPGVRMGRRMAHSGRAASISADSGVLDMAVVGKLLTMMPMQALDEVFAACIADTRASVDALRHQMRSGDTIGVCQNAHRIKGAATMIGATHIARLAAGLEMGGNKEADTPHVLDDLLSACSELERMLLAGKLKNS
jgi:CheY-like chemotaxis protein/HPt (histidine-containing phosphotransfer) domain-containing protein